MPFPFQVAGFWTGAMRKYEGFGTAYAHKQTESGDPTDGGWVNLSEQRWLNSGERHRRMPFRNGVASWGPNHPQMPCRLKPRPRQKTHDDFRQSGSGRFLLRAQSAPGRWRISASPITNAIAASSPRRNEGQRGRDLSPSMAQVIAKKESAHPGKLLIFTRGSAHTGTPFFP